MATDDELAKWQQWVDAIWHDIANISNTLRWLSEVRGMARSVAEQDPSVPGNFFHWLGLVAARDVAVGIRRQIDSDSRSISLMRLLEEIRDNCGLLTREAYVASYPEEMRSWGAENFNQYGVAHLDPQRVIDNIDILRNGTEAIRKYVNKRIAHYDKLKKLKLKNKIFIK